MLAEKHIFAGIVAKTPNLAQNLSNFHLKIVLNGIHG
jgi:hypothetical protein